MSPIQQLCLALAAVLAVSVTETAAFVVPVGKLSSLTSLGSAGGETAAAPVEASVGQEDLPQALIFDCDGVLADTERDGHRPAFNAAFKIKNLGKGRGGMREIA